MTYMDIHGACRFIAFLLLRIEHAKTQLLKVFWDCCSPFLSVSLQIPVASVGTRLLIPMFVLDQPLWMRCEECTYHQSLEMRPQ